MEASYQVSEQDYVRECYRPSNIKRRQARLIPWIIFLTAVPNLVQDMARWPLKLDAAIWGAALVIALIVVGFTRAVLRFRTWPARKAHYYQSPWLNQPATVALTEQGVRLSREQGDKLLKWGQITTWSELPKFILLHQGRHAFTPLPLQVGEQGFPLDALRARLAENVGEAR